MKRPELAIGSLCSGVGGLDMAVKAWSGASVAWHADDNPDAAYLLKTHHPETPNLGDITAPDFWERAPHTAIHAAGIPCQPFSAAGKRAGEADGRHLWPFWRRGIEIQRPSTVVLENVAGLTQGRMRQVFNTICAELVALGYGVRWCLLGACAIGACHHRHRVFLLARLGEAGCKQIPIMTCGARQMPTLRTPSARDGDARGQGTPDAMRKRVAAGHTINLGDQLILLPTPRAKEGTRGAALLTRARKDGRSNGLDLGTAVRRYVPTPRASDAAHGGPNQRGSKGDLALPSAVQPEHWGEYAAAVARHVEIYGPHPEPTEVGPKGGVRLAAPFAEWMMGYPAGYVTDHLDRRAALTRLGNGVVAEQAQVALAILSAGLMVQ